MRSFISFKFLFPYVTIIKVGKILKNLGYFLNILHMRRDDSAVKRQIPVELVCFLIGSETNSI